MKKIIIALLLISPSAYSLECFITSTCLQRVSQCSLDIHPPTYNENTHVLAQESYFSYGLRENIECISKKGNVSKTLRSSSNTVDVPYSYELKSARLPTSVDELEKKELDRLLEGSLNHCEKVKVKLVNNYIKCNQ